MNRGRARIATPVLCIAVAALCCSPSHAGPAAASHCAAGETVVFSCAARGKTISVCGSRDLADTASYIQYRFGEEDRTEISLPRDPASWRSVVRSGVMTFAGGGGAYLTFANPPYRYVVYTAIGRGWGEKAGVAVEQGGKRIASYRCGKPVTSLIGPDLFATAGVPPDDAGFDLP